MESNTIRNPTDQQNEGVIEDTGPKSGTVGVDAETMQTMVLRKRKETREVEEKLVATTIKFGSRMSALHEREQAFQLKSDETQATMARMRPYIEDNDNKRKKALEKADAEIIARQKIEEEVYHLSTELKDATSDEKIMYDEIQSITKYEQYLRAVMEAAASRAESFADAKDVLTRYATLKQSNTDLQATSSELLTTLERTRNATSLASKKMHDTALVAASTVQALQQRLEEVRSELVELTSLQEGVDASVRKSRGTLGATEASIHNLMGRVVTTAPLNCLAVSNIVQYVSSSGTSSSHAKPKAGGFDAEDMGMDGDAEGEDGEGGGLLSKGPGAVFGKGLNAIGERLSDLIAMKQEYAEWKAEKEMEASNKAAPLLDVNGNPISRPATAGAGLASAVGGSGAAAVRAMSAKTRGGGGGGGLGTLNSSRALTTLSSNNPNVMSSGRLGLAKNSITSLNGNLNNTRSYSMAGGMLSSSVAGGFGGGGGGANLNVNHPPGVYRTAFVLAGAPLPSNNGGNGGGATAKSSGGGFGSYGMSTSSRVHNK